VVDNKVLAEGEFQERNEVEEETVREDDATMMDGCVWAATAVRRGEAPNLVKTSGCF
jgi:hypothetical protein